MNIDINNEPENIFFTFLRDSKISYVSAGVSGLGLQLLNTENDSYKILTTNNENVVCSKLFLKLVPIYNGEIDIKFDFLIPGRTNMLMYSSLETNFWSEVQKQITIYKETNDNLEPICPPIVYTECQENDKARAFIQALINKHDNEIEYDDTDDPLIVIYNKFKRFPTLKLGIIAMGFTTDYIPLYIAIRNNRTNIRLYLELAIYELLRLYSIGYLHGDFSKSNIMINPSYNYTGTNSGRAMLIDFGLTYEHNYTDTSILTILNNMLQTRVPFTNILPIEHVNYKWLQEYITTYGTNIVDTFKELSSQIINHNSLMIDMIQNTYPDILSQIRNYNGATTNNNIFSGGFVSNIENVPNEMIMQTSPKNNIYVKPVDTISITQFNNIFNPKKLDIFKLKDAYLRTLNLGQQTISGGIKSIKGRKGGKKPKRTLQNRKRKHKTRKKVGGGLFSSVATLKNMKLRKELEDRLRTKCKDGDWVDKKRKAYGFIGGRGKRRDMYSSKKSYRRR